jgi:hypothetical protein
MASVSDQGDVRWMTYAELGRVRGISTASATRLAFRRKWQRQGGNDGTARVAVPASEAQRQPERSHDNRDDDRGDVRRLVSALEAAIAASGERTEADAATIAALQSHLASQRSRADALADQVEHELARADRAEAGREAERARADALADQAYVTQANLAAAEVAVDQARRDAQAAQDRAEAIARADDARRARGVLARLRAAWRGE